MTTDGAANEQLSSIIVVEQGNNLHCAAHKIQLVVNDILDSKKAHPSPEGVKHRAVIAKANSLVIYINSHRETYKAFKDLASAKRVSGNGAKFFDSLVLNVATRWDSEFALLERLVYFDNEILQLY
jgi:hypothetical protein